MRLTRRERLCSVRSATAVIVSAVLAAAGGCGGGGNDTVTVQEGNTTRTISTRSLRPINLQEGKAIAANVASGRKTLQRLTTEERRQLNAFVEVVKKPVKRED